MLLFLKWFHLRGKVGFVNSIFYINPIFKDHQQVTASFCCIEDNISVCNTPHAQREWGKVIGVGVHIYVCGQKKNLNRTLAMDSRLALPLLAPEKLSSLSKSRISIFNAHQTLFVRRMTSHNSIGKYRHLVNLVSLLKDW